MFFYHYTLEDAQLNKLSRDMHERYLNGHCIPVTSCGNGHRVYKTWIKEESSYCYFMVDESAEFVIMNAAEQAALRSLIARKAKGAELTTPDLARYQSLLEKRELERSQKRVNPAVLGFCLLEKRPRWVALETTMMYVNPHCRGQGIASLLYDAIMRDGVIVISGYSHNKKSRKLWMSLVKNPRYVTWAHDIVNLNRHAAISIDEEKDTFACTLKLYEDIKKMRRRRKSDVRIIAFNPRYA